jgi:GT2 family glycosyltransferase
MTAQWRNGEFELKHEDAREAKETMFLQGGSCSFRRREFEDFGGFNPVFAPGYWEDYDLSYQALKAGWRNLYNPKAAAFHLGQGSMRKAFGAYIDVVKARNSYFFLWLNVTDEDKLRDHFLSLPRNLARECMRNSDADFAVRGFARALSKSSEIVRARQKRSESIKLRDCDVLAKFA